jgi:hypothetical protein
MRIRHCLFALLAMWLLASQSATADVVKYEFLLDGLSEAPPNASPGTGSALVTIDTTAITMRVEASFSGLLSTSTNAHIHCCDFVGGPPPATTAGVATTTPTFPGFPAGVTSGVYDNTFDMTLASSYRAGFITANGGTTSGAFSALLGGLDSGMAYFNIHSSAFPGGEIRGFAQLIPEPTSAILTLVGLGLPLLLRRSR